MSLPDRLRTDLKDAMKSNDQLRVRTIRSLMAVIDNAGAVEVESKSHDPRIGLGHDVDRREVSHDEIRERFLAERAELLQAASEFRDLGQGLRADELETRAGIVTEYVE